MTAPLFADMHAACVTQHHDCDRTTMITSTCCGDDAGPGQAGPVESRVQLTVRRSPAATPVIAVAVPTPWIVAARPQTSPPRAGPLDLPTRFARLLI